MLTTQIIGFTGPDADECATVCANMMREKYSMEVVTMDYRTGIRAIIQPLTQGLTRIEEWFEDQIVRKQLPKQFPETCKFTFPRHLESKDKKQDVISWGVHDLLPKIEKAMMEKKFIILTGIRHKDELELISRLHGVVVEVTKGEIQTVPTPPSTDTVGQKRKKSTRRSTRGKKKKQKVTTPRKENTCVDFTLRYENTSDLGRLLLQFLNGETLTQEDFDTLEMGGCKMVRSKNFISSKKTVTKPATDDVPLPQLDTGLDQETTVGA